MEQWNIECCKCGKFLLSERKIHEEGKPSKIEYVGENYDGEYYYDEIADKFYCLDCKETYDEEN